jgi:Trk-type K+ transport system membrane component
MMKLLRFIEVRRFFDHIDIKTRKNSAFSVTRIVFTLYFFAAFVHFWTCIWLITGRVDWSRHTAGWYRMDKFDMNPTMLEMYFESMHFIVSTFTGAGFGNIAPSTNFEFFVCTLLDLVGCSLFIVIFVDFTMEYKMRDLKKYQNNLLLDETL